MALLACTSQAGAALRIDSDDAGLSPEVAAATRALVDAALARLPPAFAERLDADIALRWRDDLPADVHGRTRGGGIGLRRELLDGWMRHDAAAPGADPASRAALAALLHELAHVYDRSRVGGLSRDPRLLDLAGWPVRPLRFGSRSRRNDFSDRSPDRYELASPAEFVAVNLEHFLLDPEYACRRPALHRHFVAHFGWSPPHPACAAQMPFVSAGEGEDMIRLLGLEPSRVQAVDYLFAEPDSRAMSRWGHGMLRLVVCAPGRARDADCRLDLQHHVVLSFRAFVDDVQVSNWRGLTGSYPARLFVLPLEQVIDEYTKVELRGLRSVPLLLGDDEIAALLERAAQVHWSYDGRYYFIGNNCAVETWKLLHAGVPRLAAMPLRSITPTGLLRRLRREGIADASVLDDAGEALRLGYRFESQAAHFDAMFAVADDALSLPSHDATAWFALDPAQRTPWLQRGDLRASAALLLLEQAALRREEAMAREALKQRFLRGRRKDADIATASEALRELLANGAYAGRPALLLQGNGYGLPQEVEREALAHAVGREDVRLQALQAGLRSDARRLVPAERRARLARTEANLERLGAHLRALDASHAHP